MSNSLPIIIFILGFISMLLLLIKLSGWDKLAKKYGYSQKFSGKVFWLATAYIGIVRFRNCIGIGINESGLYLNPLVIFRLNHPPIFVPWGEISHFEIKQGVFGIGQYYVLDIGFPKIGTVKLPSRVFSNHPEIVMRFTGSD